MSWLLVEILGDKPTIIADGDRARRSRSLHSYLRGQELTTVRQAVQDAQRTGEPGQITESGRTVHALPVSGPSGQVLGVQVWSAGDPGSTPAPPRVAASEWDLTDPSVPPSTRWTAQFRTLYGVLDDRGADEPFGLADFFSRIPNVGEITRAMHDVSHRAADSVFVNEFIARHDDGTARVIRSTRRAVRVGERTLLRGMDHDITAAEPEVLHLDTVDHDIAALCLRRWGADGVIVDLRHGTAIAWISPVPHGVLDREVAGGIQPLLHSADRADLVDVLRARASASAQVRVRTGQGWSRRTVHIDRVPGYGDAQAALLVMPHAGAPGDAA